jgi:dTDP-L-rhamnose 4-epimerase
VYHLAGVTGVGQSQYQIARYISSNTYGTAVVLEVAVAARVRQVVIASSRAVYGEGAYYCPSCHQTFLPASRGTETLSARGWDIRCTECHTPAEPIPVAEDIPLAPVSIYGLSKLQQEQLARQAEATHGLPVTILRLFNVYGPGQSLNNPYSGVLGTFFRRARSNLPVEIYEDGHMQRDWIYVQDAVEVLAAVTGEPRAFGCTLNVGTGRGVTMIEAATQLLQAMGVEPRIRVSGKYRVGDVRNMVADTSRMRQLLGLRPQTRFEDGVRAYVNWALQSQADASDAAAEAELGPSLLRQGPIR